MTIDETLQRAAQKMDRAFTERVEKNFASMVEDGLTDDFIKEFQRLEAEAWPAVRDDILAKLRAWLEHDGKTLQ